MASCVRGGASADLVGVTARAHRMPRPHVGRTRPEGRATRDGRTRGESMQSRRGAPEVSRVCRVRVRAEAEPTTASPRAEPPTRRPLRGRRRSLGSRRRRAAGRRDYTGARACSGSDSLRSRREARGSRRRGLDEAARARGARVAAPADRGRFASHGRSSARRGESGGRSVIPDERGRSEGGHRGAPRRDHGFEPKIAFTSFCISS
jgi:hypothetical protein